jgi:hypothetical protein
MNKLGPIMNQTLPVKIWRSTDPAEIVRIMNDPAVFPMISVPGMEHFTVDVIQEILDDPRNVLLMAGGGGFLFMNMGEGIYEIHTNFLPSRRGRHVVEAGLAAAHWMFTHTDCWMLQTRVPVFNRAADLITRHIGASLYFERKRAWPTKHGLVDIRFYVLSLIDWARKYPQALVEAGRGFHSRLESEFARFGIKESHHPPDDAHDRAVGLAVEMVRGGQPEKAVILYNRWARFAGYGEIAMMQRNPLVLDIGDAVLLMENETFKMLTCRLQK